MVYIHTYIHIHLVHIHMYLWPGSNYLMLPHIGTLITPKRRIGDAVAPNC